MPQAAPEPRKTLDPDRVAEWLARHPDFFVGREGLLQSLKVPHPETQGATSLLERLVYDLRKRAEGAELRLEQLLDSARHNEAQYRRTRELVLALLEAQDNDALGQALATQLSERFQTPAVAVWCPASLTDRDPRPPQAPRHVLDEHTGQRLTALLDGRASRCTRLTPTDWKRLVPHAKAPTKSGSCAIARMTLGEPQGFVVLASADPDHFRASMDTLFTEYLADVLVRLSVRLSEHDGG
ncbi:DUF484 family protein [Halomonas denitrificans]|uniref:DUF484 family protein n=1 Tax=Halomonas TaxID=2745 RepID=UPI001A8EBA09|nr:MULTISPECIES: DUF484 family protein [Halomonas]MED5296581.1 DUF484 family protein [Pseudomonadota bacterium]MBN8412939.1 DUF484 family protein [Halomonas litopenaei]MBY5925255.1 DUF484 family protein [Halomonas sp. DP4Y7-2]MBY5929069.1 DUF484 family protein [Halomonas sp. DP8Y7-3]MBY5968162.1 DUF484 family protein [Halomonas denitrificans]